MDKFIFPNGDIYEGEHLNDVPHGFGKMKMNNGSSYEGNWINGKMYGI